MKVLGEKTDSSGLSKGYASELGFLFGVAPSKSSCFCFGFFLVVVVSLDGLFSVWLFVVFFFKP